MLSAMAQRDDVTRILCVDCDSAYATRQWPDGTVKLIGQERCPCGSSEFTVIDDTDDFDSKPASSVDDLIGDDQQLLGAVAVMANL